MAPQLAHFKKLIKEYCDEERINQGRPNRTNKAQ